MPGCGNLGFQPIFFRLVPTGLSPSLAGLFRPFWPSRMRRRLVPQPYISRKFPYKIWFGLFPFRSLLLGESLLVSFPPPTKMFQFRGFPLPYGSTMDSVESTVRSLIRVSPVLNLHAATRGVSLLAAPFFGVQALPSSRRRFMSGLFLVVCLFGVVCGIRIWAFAWFSL